MYEITINTSKPEVRSLPDKALVSQVLGSYDNFQFLQLFHIYNFAKGSLRSNLKSVCPELNPSLDEIKESLHCNLLREHRFIFGSITYPLLQLVSHL